MKKNKKKNMQSNVANSKLNVTTMPQMQKSKTQMMN